MIKTILFLAARILCAATAHAQTVSVDINSAKILWTWEQAPESGPVDAFKVYCGPSAGNYTKITDVGPAAREAPIKSIITGAGNWTCAVRAANTLGESAESNLINFGAGAGPAGKIAVTLQSK